MYSFLVILYTGAGHLFLGESCDDYPRFCQDDTECHQHRKVNIFYIYNFKLLGLVAYAL